MSPGTYENVSAYLFVIGILCFVKFVINHQRCPWCWQDRIWLIGLILTSVLNMALRLRYA